MRRNNITKAVMILRFKPVDCFAIASSKPKNCAHSAGCPPMRTSDHTSKLRTKQRHRPKIIIHVNFKSPPKSVVSWLHIQSGKSGFCPANRRGFAAAFRAAVPLAAVAVFAPGLQCATATRALKRWTRRWL